MTTMSQTTMTDAIQRATQMIQHVQLQDHTTLQHVQDHLIVNLFLQKLSCRVHLRLNL